MIADINVEQRTFAEVAKITGLDANILRHLVRSGVIDGVVQPKTGAGSCHTAQARAIAAQFEAAREQVAGQGILVTEAAAKYSFSTSTLYRWLSDGWVRILNTTDHGDRLFDEGDIAVARALADLVGYTGGRSVFPAKPRSGRPPKNKNPL